MADNVAGAFEDRWEWSIGRDDDGGALWHGTIKQKGNASPSWLSYEHGDSPQTSSAKRDAPHHPDITSATLCSAIWPVVDEYLRERG